MALDRDTPQTREGIALFLVCTEQGIIAAQEPPWLSFTLPELGFPMITDKYHNLIHPEVANYIPSLVTDEQDWETVDDEDCWGKNYTRPMKGKIDSFLHTWGGEDPEDS